MSNSNLQSARTAKNDEFYTQLPDIERELSHYKHHLEGKVVYCPCDDPNWSNFYLFFKREFEVLGLAKLVATHYVPESSSFKREYDGEQEIDTPLQGDGDFRSDECKTILDEADVVVTNPPFSLFRDFISLLVSKNKLLLVVGNVNAITYKEIFKLIKEDKLWLGVSPRSMTFLLPNGDSKQVNACWFTNLTHFKRNLPIDLYEKYDPSECSKYDNYDAIEVSKVVNIPQDYYEPMGVPITFLEKYCPNQFEIIRFRKGNDDKDLSINGKTPYFRIIIKRKRVEEDE